MKIILVANANARSKSLQGVSVLIPHFTEGNRYIEELGKAYQSMGAQVIYGRDNLFLRSAQVHLIHLNWPESIYRWAVSGSPEKKAGHMIQALQDFKKNGTKILWTVHNLHPHEYSNDPLDFLIYQKVIDLSDAVIHFCDESVNLLKEKYHIPASIPQIVTSGTNTQNISNTITSQEARRLLNLASDSFVFLKLGYIRQYKGIFRLIRAFWSVSVENKILILAGSYQAASSRSSRLDLLLLRLIAKFDRRIRLHTTWIEEVEIQNYVNASNCVVIGNVSGLNSAVAALAMSFGKLVIGPKVGCIPCLLRQGENLIYENQSQLIQSMESAPTMDPECVRMKNISASLKWSWSEMIAQALESISFTH